MRAIRKIFTATERRRESEWMEPVLDFHTHAQNVFGMCCVARPLRPFLRNGLARLYEKTGFHPAMVRAESARTHRMIAREMQSRFASFDFGDYLAAMKRNGVTHACALPTERSCMRDCARRKTGSIRQTCSTARRTFRPIRLAPHGEVSTEKGMRNSLRSSKYFIAGLPRLPKCTRVRFGSIASF